MSMQSGELAIGGQLAVVLLGPPIMACLWYLVFRLWTGMLGTTDRPWVQRWRKTGFWVLMGAMYALGVALFIYAHFMK